MKPPLDLTHHLLKWGERFATRYWKKSRDAEAVQSESLSAYRRPRICKILTAARAVGLRAAGAVRVGLSGTVGITGLRLLVVLPTVLVLRVRKRGGRYDKDDRQRQTLHFALQESLVLSSRQSTSRLFWDPFIGDEVVLEARMTPYRNCIFGFLINDKRRFRRKSFGIHHINSVTARLS